MSKNQYIPIASRTRFQYYKYCEYEAKKNAASKSTSPQTNHDNEAGSSASKVRVKKEDSLDYSDSDVKQRGADESQNNMKTDSLQSTEDDEDDSLSSSENNSEYEPKSSTEGESDNEQSSSSDSESDNSEDSNLLPLKRKKPASKTVLKGLGRQTKKKCDEAKKVNKVLVDESEEENNHYKGTSKSKARLQKSYKIDESSSDEESKESNTEPEESDGVEELDMSEFEKHVLETVGYNSEESNKSGTRMNVVYLSADSDSDEKKEVVTEADGIQSNSKADTLQFPEDNEVGRSSYSESGDEDELPAKRKQSSMEKTKGKARSGLTDRKEHIPLVQKTRMKKSGTCMHVVHPPVYSDSDDKKEAAKEADGRQSNSMTDTFQFPEDDGDEPPVKRKQSSMEKSKEKVRSGSIDRKEHDPLVNKTRMKKMDKEPMDELSDIGVHKRKKSRNIDRDTMGESSGLDRDTRVDKSSSDEHEESNKGSPKDDGGSLDAILDSVIANEVVQGKKYISSYTFRFNDSEDESKTQKTDEFGAEGLFEEMNFAFGCDDMGYRDSTVEKHEKDKNISPIVLCGRGEHGDVYFEEKTGYRCCVCGAVTLETKDAISKHATYAPNKSKRSYRFNEHRLSSPGNLYPEGADCNSLDNMCHETRGTVWELIPTSIRSHLYPHQRQAFKFLWENLAGTIDFSELHKLGSRGGNGGGGCIISHAPGTGKTLLTIVFVDTFLKRFPRCCPVIVAPASTLLTWEAETKKWPLGFSFINLSSSEAIRKERNNGSSRHNKDSVRAMKIRSWSEGGSVLGISYNLYTKLAGISNTKKKSPEKVRNVLLDMPGLVVLDEGHTPRNKKSSNWNTLLKLKTKKRVILSGTLFQNNFTELFNSLRLVRPEIVKGKVFSDMIRQNMKRSRSRLTCEDVEKISKIISPFAHVHKGHILESKLPGLKETVILLDPPPIQKSLIENLENMTTAFEYEHKVALFSVHPSLILHWSLSEKEEKLVNKQELEKMRLQPDCGVKTRFIMELIRLSVSLHEKVLIFSQYLKPLELLQDQVARAFHWNVGTEIVVIDGRITQVNRQAIINDFNDPNGEGKVLLASTRCCSEGIHLYGASRVVLLDVVWNPSVESQAISRAYRLGQKKVVYTYHLIAGTTEEDKYNQQVEKARVAEMVFSSGSIASAEVSRKVTLDDKILQHMLDHQELKHMFKKIRYPKNQTRV